MFLKVINDKKGFSLLEMLMVLAMAGVLFAGIFWSLTFQKISSAKQTALSDIFENTRFSMDTLTRSIRLAGLDMNYRKFNVAAVGIVQKPVTPYNKWKYGTDKIVIQYVKPDPLCPDTLSLNSAMPSTSSEFKTTPIPDCWANMPSPFFAMISDPDMENSDIFAITQVQQSASHIQHHTITIGGDSWPKYLSSAYPIGSTITMITWETDAFYIDFDANGHNRLVLDENDDGNNLIPLATDIEDLQFAYALDVNGDGKIDDLNGTGKLDDGDYISNVNSANYRFIRAVRISVCFRSRDWVTKQPNSIRPVIEDHGIDSSAKPDGFARKTITSRVKIRNLDASFKGM